METEVFNLNRFWRYFKSDFDAFISRYGITLLVISTLGLSLDLIIGLFSLTSSGTWQGLIGPMRGALFFGTSAMVLIGSPAKLYGYVTDKKEGSAFLLLPVSTLEKYISMILITCIVVPLMFFMIYFGLDVMVCMIDPTCGTSLFSFIFYSNDFNLFNDETAMAMSEWNEFIDHFRVLLNPALYIDDIIGTSLMFLLGALIFKTSKMGKTLGSIILISIAIQVVITPILAITGLSAIKDLNSMDLTQLTADQFKTSFPFYSWIGLHLGLIDTLSDMLVNCLLLFFIWFRVKRIKH
jgi:hypothetical protein